MSSEDTYYGRLVTNVYSYHNKGLEKKMETEFNPQAFKLASADNIDVS